MLRVCSPFRSWVERRCSLGNCMKTQVDSAENRVVCLKGFEDDGRGSQGYGPSLSEAAAQCGFARIFDKRLNVPVVRFALELSSSDLT